MGKTPLVFAACAMDALLTQADRILLPARHMAFTIDRQEFRHRLVASIEKWLG